MAHTLPLTMPSIALIIASFAVITASVQCAKGTGNLRNIEKNILDSIIGEGRYDSRIRPAGVPLNFTGNGKDGPAIVRVNLYVRSIARIDDVTMVRLILLHSVVTKGETSSNNKQNINTVQTALIAAIAISPIRV